MSSYNFEGDLENISERQLKFINDVILKHGFKNSKTSFQPIGEPGDNYAASIKRILIEGDHEVFQMVAKVAPTKKIVRESFNTAVMFKNEDIIYTKILPKLVQFQENAGVPKKEQLRYAKCYGSLSEEPNEVILLEDLKTSDFIMLDRLMPLSNEHVKSILKNFALLHSLSYVLRHKEPETFDEFKISLTDIWSLNVEMIQYKVHCETLENDTPSVLQNEEYTNIVRHKIMNILDLAKKLSKADFDSKFSVVLQGDCWTNNVMFKFENGQLAASVMIDYQASKIGSPVYDILYMLLNCTDHVTRKQYFNDWLDYYYNELEKSLSNFNLNADMVYPRDIFNSDLKRYCPYMFGICVFLASLIFRKIEDAAKVVDILYSTNIKEEAKKMAISLTDEDTKACYKNRVIEIIKTITEFGLFSTEFPVEKVTDINKICFKDGVESNNLVDLLSALGSRSGTSVGGVIMPVLTEEAAPLQKKMANGRVLRTAY